MTIISRLGVVSQSPSMPVGPFEERERGNELPEPIEKPLRTWMAECGEVRKRGIICPAEAAWARTTRSRSAERSKP